MKLSKSKWLIVGSLISVLLIFLLWPKDERNNLKAVVTKGDFKIEVNTSGELKAKESEDIKGPTGLRSHGIWQIKITDLITEGSYVKAGEYVAQLDKSEVGTKIIAASTEVEKITSEYEQARLDTVIEMMQLKDELLNLTYAIEEKQLIFDQSTYEAPAVRRQSEIDLEKTKRSHSQKANNILLKREQNTAKLRQIQLSLNQEQSTLTRLEELLSELKIIAPKDGMVVYKRTWDGTKITSGSQISVWDPTVATLPDLSKMVTQTYVNEIDISNLKKGLHVSLSVDAFPDKVFTGEVVDVANVGEQLPNSDSKVFEVTVEINEQDTLLRPSMTTNNNILIEELKEVLYIPQEGVFVNDTISYVVVESGIGLKKQKVTLGKTNANYVVVKEGLKEGEEILLVKPEDVESIAWR
ncbi:MAG: HlyD family efflux transporter periplasmic adaptor subunit [Bacteroidetes bacterium]|nr:MAG: HlyD family efflux transporter periplasmic adaptor subunit [Bacteroidota bacterium]MBL1144777.1 HlyD family efflux transporter periplasmic adaptor subunit [Bacteroidota bacterium]MCB0802058.1 efflux RND transporter periplasmic adaptor subunit [Flavobacteriales bacterium]NOG57571.1 HlyD family efflux transporter periplasmic adaptor subunit [Bacteroidota bacterium]